MKMCQKIRVELFMYKAKAIMLALVLPFCMNLEVKAELSPQYSQTAALTKTYKKVTKSPELMRALEAMKGSLGDFSRRAILGENISKRPIKIMFKSPGSLNPSYAGYDALGWKNGKQLYVYINPKHRTAPAEALASLLSHEALHQDKYNSINEETYAWTLEGAVWTEFLKKNPALANYSQHPLVRRENTISKLFVKGGYSDRYVRNTVASNPGYRSLPGSSPGFENIDRLTRGLKPSKEVGNRTNTNRQSM